MAKGKRVVWVVEYRSKRSDERWKPERFHHLNRLDATMSARKQSHEYVQLEFRVTRYEATR